MHIKVQDFQWARLVTSTAGSGGQLFVFNDLINRPENTRLKAR
jgi:hypothetical protein